MTRASPEPLPAALAETLLGWAGVAVTPAGIRRATLFHVTPEAAARELEAFGADPSRSAPLAAEACRRLRAYASGEVRALDGVPLDLPPSIQETARRVLLTLRNIPPGETRTYVWLAETAGLGRSGARAVGAIVGANPLPLWLPCHRVVAADGSLHGFAGGLAMKRRLLELERAIPATLL